MENKNFVVEKTSPQEAVLQLEEYSTYSIIPKFAKEIAEGFGCILDKNLIRTGRGYREQVRDLKEEKVSVSCLAENICEQLKIEPDKKLMETANMMNGEGSHRSLVTQACCKVLRKHFEMEELY